MNPDLDDGQDQFRQSADTQNEVSMYKACNRSKHGRDDGANHMDALLVSERSIKQERRWENEEGGVCGHAG